METEFKNLTEEVGLTAQLVTSKPIAKRRRLWSDTRGDTGFVEWLLLVGLIAIAGFVAFKTIGSKVSKSADKAGTKIDEVTFSGTP